MPSTIALTSRALAIALTVFLFVAGSFPAAGQLFPGVALQRAIVPATGGGISSGHRGTRLAIVSRVDGVIQHKLGALLNAIHLRRHCHCRTDHQAIVHLFNEHRLAFRESQPTAHFGRNDQGSVEISAARIIAY